MSSFAPIAPLVRDGNYYVPYTVVNRGAQAIDAAQIRFEVFSDAGSFNQMISPSSSSRWMGPDGRVRHRSTIRQPYSCGPDPITLQFP